MSNPGILYTNNGTDNPPAELGTVTVDPSVISYGDGFFTFPTQLIRATPDEGEGTTIPFAFGQKLDTYTSFVDTAAMTPDVTRNLTVSGGFSNDKASNSDPKAFTYEFADNTFPNIPLIQPLEFRRGMEDHEPQQRRTSDAYSRQRLPGDGSRRSRRRHHDGHSAPGESTT